MSNEEQERRVRTNLRTMNEKDAAARREMDEERKKLWATLKPNPMAAAASEAAVAIRRLGRILDEAMKR